ncbi:MAG: CBS domain-containing protein [Gammaproteobacteria bacterium]|nr:CBS domain-containing protein [Gammaproteobacteria bacterium]
MSNENIIRVRQVMLPNFLEIDGLKTVKEAIQALKAADTDAIIVKKRNENDEYGIVLLSDIAKKVLAKDKAPERVNVYEVMKKPVITVSPDMDVRYCARLFNEYGIVTAPVVENNKVIGIVNHHGLVLRGLLEIYK